MSLQKKSILVTGATGFVGSNLARRLVRSGADLHLLLRQSSDTWRIRDIIGDVSRYTLNLSDPDAVAPVVREIRPDIIYHLATYGGSPGQDNFRQIMESNFFGTVHLLNACRRSGFDLFVNTGSSSEYGIRSSSMKESDAPEPRNAYGVSKAAATLYCQSVALNDAVAVVTLRLFSPYGDYEGPARLVPSVILSCLRGKDPVISSRDFVRDFIYIDDVIDVYERLTGTAVSPGQILNVGSGKQHSVGEVADTIVALTGNQVTVQCGFPQQWPHEPACWQADLSHIAHALGWAPRYDLVSGLKKSVDWFREHRYLYDRSPGRTP